MKDDKHIIMLSLVVILILLTFTLFTRGIIGIFKSNIEKDARKSQQVDSTWLCSKDVTNEMGALLFYDSELNHHTFSIYLNHDGLSYGYFFREGSSLGTVDFGIEGFSYQSKGMALVSMNEKNVATIQMSTRQNIETISLNSQKPFAVIIPSSIDEVRLYNSNGEDVSIDNISAY